MKYLTTVLRFIGGTIGFGIIGVLGYYLIQMTILVMVETIS